MSKSPHCPVLKKKKNNSESRFNNLGRDLQIQLHQEVLQVIGEELFLLQVFCLVHSRFGKLSERTRILIFLLIRVMVATVRCDEIANERFGCLTSDAEWLDLENDVQAGSVLGFGKKLGSIVEVHMEEYDKEAVYFDEAVRKAKRQLLESRILNLVQPAFQKNLSHLRTKALEKFKTGLDQSLESGKGFAASVRETTESSLSEFNQGCADSVIKQADWDYSKILEKVRRDIEDHALSVRESKLT
uniref:Sey1/RHD3-like three-helix bundle domain-containing protein n=1 Tax=Aegilops tauschii subsp. strangulata TaxID=200361 RepID=A0A453JR60_AEGTS